MNGSLTLIYCSIPSNVSIHESLQELIWRLEHPVWNLLFITYTAKPCFHDFWKNCRMNNQRGRCSLDSCILNNFIGRYIMRSYVPFCHQWMNHLKIIAIIVRNNYLCCVAHSLCEVGTTEESKHAIQWNILWNLTDITLHMFIIHHPFTNIIWIVSMLKRFSKGIASCIRNGE